jgi:hypothetical protein
MYKPILPLLLFCLLFYTCQVFGQDRNADSLQSAQTEAYMLRGFNNAIGKQSRLYNGPDFSPYPFISATNANYRDTLKFTAGTVNYEGIVYTNVPLIYNIHKDLVLTLLYNRLFTYSLLSERLFYFDIMGHHFINFQPDSLNKQMAPGFYDELYHGKHQVLARYIKNLQTINSGQTIDKVFFESSTYYLKKGNRYYSVSSANDFYKLLGDKKKELKKYFNDSNVNFKHNREQAMVMLASYYDKITN